MDIFLSIPHIDVIYKEIFSYLPLTDLINLHYANKGFQAMIELYMEKYCKNIDYSDMFSLENPFQNIIDQRTDIRKLIFTDCVWLTDEEITKFLVQNKQQLSYLDLSGCKTLSGKILDEISHLQGLKHLDLSFCDFSATQIAKNIRHLEYQNIKECWKITDECINLITTNNINLEELYLSDCQDLTPDGYRLLGKNLNQLKH